MKNLEVRALGPGDEAALERFLSEHLHSSLFLLSNARASGLRDGDAPYQGAYVAAFAQGALRAVAALYWNGNLVLQAPEYLEPLLGGLAGRAPRPVRGLVGPWAQVEQARRVLGLEAARATLESQEVLFALPLARLRIPPALDSGEVHSRRPREDEVELLVRWRHDYLVEVMGKRPGEALMAEARDVISRAMGEGSLFVLTHGQECVALTAFNARLREVVQVGGVFTPPSLRGRGYARAAVAGSLRTALAEGCQSAVLFTPVENLPAQRAYRSIGFEAVGDYGLIALEQAHPLHVPAGRAAPSAGGVSEDS